MIKNKLDGISWIETSNKIKRSKKIKLIGSTVLFLIILRLLTHLRKMTMLISKIVENMILWNTEVNHSNINQITPIWLNKTITTGWFFLCKIGIRWCNSWRYIVDKFDASVGGKMCNFHKLMCGCESCISAFMMRV